VDISSGLINIANKENTFSNVRFVVNDMLNFVENQQDQTFDFVVAVASFQHIPTRWERLLILKHIYRILTYE
jgi:ubiquinone/menaquinone biosynthesis C-methylase UbiE